MELRTASAEEKRLSHVGTEVVGIVGVGVLTTQGDGNSVQVPRYEEEVSLRREKETRLSVREKTV